MSESPLLTTAEVAERIGRSPSVVARMVKTGRARPHRKLPGRTGAYLFDDDEVKRLRDVLHSVH